MSWRRDPLVLHLLLVLLLCVAEDYAAAPLLQATADGPGGILQAVQHFGFAERKGRPAPRGTHVRCFPVALLQGLHERAVQQA